MTSPIITITVPVYNAEKYIRQCLDSLTCQTLQEIEIIVINDGSTDTTKAICQEYAQKDSRVVLISKENGGIASARQAALEVAQGKYMCSVDADDWVVPTMCEMLLNTAEKEGADIVLFDYWSEYGDYTKEHHYGRSIPPSNDLITDEALLGGFPCAVWNKMIKLDALRRFSISFASGINLGEDYLVILKLLQHPVKWAYCSDCLYHYRRMPRENSYTNNITKTSYTYLLKVHDWIEENLDKTSHKRGIAHDLTNIAFAGLRVKGGLAPDYYKKTSLSKLSYTDLLKEHSLKSLLILWTKVFGFKAGTIIVKMLYSRFYR